MAASARHLAGKKEARLSQALCELVNGGAEDSCGLLPHVLDRVDAKAVEVGVRDPILVTVDQALQCWRGRRVFRAPVDGEVQFLEVEEIAFDVLGREIKIRYPSPHQ